MKCNTSVGGGKVVEMEWETVEENGFEVKVEEPKIPEIEDGKYKAYLTDIRVIDTKYGKAWQWVFNIPAEDEDEEDVEVTGVTTTRFVVGSKAYRWWSNIMGREPQVGEKVNLLDAIHKECIVVIQNIEGRYGGRFPRVVDVLPLPKKKKKA